MLVARLLYVFGKISLAISIGGLIISLLLYVIRGPAVYLFLVLGNVLRPLLSLLFLLVAIKVFLISMADTLGRDWNISSLTPSASRASLIQDACTVVLLAFTLVFWYRYGGLGPDARRSSGAPESVKASCRIQ
jgi:hypothetical protein